MDDENPAEAESDNSAKEGTNESEVVEVKEEETTQAAEVTSEQPRGLGDLLRLDNDSSSFVTKDKFLYRFIKS